MKNINLAIIAAALALGASSAFAWGRCVDGTTAVWREGTGSRDWCPCGNNVFVSTTERCPAPPAPPPPAQPPAPAPAPTTANAQAIASNLATAIGGGANIGPIVSQLESNPTLMASVMTHLSPEQRVAVEAAQQQNQAQRQRQQQAAVGTGGSVFFNYPAPARIPVTPGGVNQPAPAIPMIQGGAGVDMSQALAIRSRGPGQAQGGVCEPAKPYKQSTIAIRHPRATGDEVDQVQQGLVIDHEALTTKDPATGKLTVTKPQFEVDGEVEVDGVEYRIVSGEIMNPLPATATIASTTGFQIQIGGVRGSVGGGASGSGANSFTQILYLPPTPCQMIQAKMGSLIGLKGVTARSTKGETWVTVNITVDQFMADLQNRAAQARAPQKPETDNAEILAAIAALPGQIEEGTRRAMAETLATATIQVAVPQQTVVRQQRECRRVPILNKETGKEELRCLGSVTGTYTATTVQDAQPAIVQGTLGVRAGADSGKK